MGNAEKVFGLLEEPGWGRRGRAGRMRSGDAALSAGRRGLWSSTKSDAGAHRGVGLAASRWMPAIRTSMRRAGIMKGGNRISASSVICQVLRSEVEWEWVTLSAVMADHGSGLMDLTSQGTGIAAAMPAACIAQS